MTNTIADDSRDIQAIAHLKKSIAENEPWYFALLEAINIWTSTQENYNGRHYQYLIDNEAFDWLLLAERLLEEVKEFVPEQEIINLLFFDKPPIEVTREKFKELIGSAKYQAYLNYLYGILMEEMLILTVMEEIRKRKRSSGLSKDGDTLDEAFLQIYGGSQIELLTRYKKEKKRPLLKTINLAEIQEFTYWLFRERIKRSDKSCVASDTKKALLQLHRYTRLKGKRTIQQS
jgi:hypothetical protein